MQASAQKKSIHQFNKFRHNAYVVATDVCGLSGSRVFTTVELRWLISICHVNGDTVILAHVKRGL